MTFFYLSSPPMQVSHVFHSSSMCSGHKFRDLEMMSSQNSEEGEEEQSLQQHPQALRAVLEQSGSQSPDVRMVGAYSACPRPHRVCTEWLPSPLTHCGAQHPGGQV